MSYKSRLLHSLANSTIILAFVLLLLGFSWLYWPYKVADVKSPAKVLTKTVYAGEAMKYEIDFCSYSNTPATLSRRLVNGVIFTLPTITTFPDKGCRKDVVATTVIPETLPQGMYYLEVTAIHKVNPLRTITVTWRTEEFHVIRPYETY